MKTKVQVNEVLKGDAGQMQKNKAKCGNCAFIGNGHHQELPECFFGETDECGYHPQVWLRKDGCANHKQRTTKAMLDEIDNDKRWDNGELGCDGDFAKAVVLTPEQEAGFDRMYRDNFA